MTTQMTLRANSDPRYYLRFLLMGVVAIGFALWSLYDGAIAYPAQRVRALKYKELEKEDRADQWPAYARERDWPTERPGKPKDEDDFAVQFIMATLAGTIGLFLLVVVMRSRGRWIEADESGLKSSWGKSFEFIQVVSLDKKRWRSKGIAKITYENGDRRGRFVLDDYKFERATTDMILRQLESKIAAEKIVGGPPEPPLEETSDDDSTPVADESGKSDG